MVKLLFIEDKPTDALLMQSFLRGSKKEKFDIFLASSFCAGQCLLMRKDFDIILLSLDLKDIRSVKAAIFTLKSIKNVPIIVCTNSKDDNLRIIALNSGAYAFVVKNQIQVTMLIDQVKFVSESFKRSSTTQLMSSRHIF